MSICIFAASNSQTGVYKGKTYRAYVHCSDTTAKASMSWEGTQYDVMVRVSLEYYNFKKQGIEWIGKSSNYNQKFAEKSVSVPYDAVAYRAHCDGLIDDIPFVNDIKAYPGR